MKLLIAATIALTLTGCAGKWNEYADSNQCVATAKTMSKPTTEFASGSYMGSGMNFGGSAAPSTRIRYEQYRLYKCSNGSIWGPFKA